MTRIRRLFYFGFASLILTAGPPAIAQTQYSERTLTVKQMFAEAENEAITEPYVGIRTSSENRPDLFSIEGTGSSTSPTRQAAESVLGELSVTQKLRTQYSIDSAEWRRWSNVDNDIYARRGVSLQEMNDSQRQSALNLMSVSLSERGYELSRNIMKTDATLREINPDNFSLGEDLYYFTFMGIPSAAEPWGWQLDGHHLIVNYFVLGEQVVMTPLFVGGEPAVTDSGKYAGNTILQDEQNQGLELLQSLNEDQKSKAIIDSRKTGNNMEAGAGQDNLILNTAGIPASALTGQQRESLVKLIWLYVGNLNEGHARVRMAEIQRHLDETYFAWVGATSDDAVFYYRIHSPVVLIEFDHQCPVGLGGLLPRGQPTRQHIHAIVRTPNGNDYGKDLLRQHLEEHAH